MRGVVRSLWVVVLALASTVGLAVAWTTATAVQLLATALIMGGTDHPLSTPPDDPVLFINPYMDNAIDGYINPAADTPTGTTGEGIEGVDVGDDRYAVIYPAEFFPVFGSMTFADSVAEGVENLNSCIRGTGCTYNEDDAIDPPAPELAPVAGDDFVAFAYSQSAVVASLIKQDLIDNPPPAGTNVSFFLLANAMRPNGGILARGPEGLTIPILGVTFYGDTPTNSCETGTCYATVDAAAQYDILGGDAPASYTNVLALLNGAAGYYYLHGDLQNRSFDEALYQGSFGDTDYYLFPAERLPILMPFEGIVPSPILTLLDDPIRAAIEGAYAREVNPGVATAASLLPFRNPIQTVLNIIAAIPTGIDDALAEATGDPTFRPLGTTPVTSPFGVGGPELPDPPEALTTLSVGDDAAEQDALQVQSLGADDPDASQGDPVGRIDEEPEADEDAVDEEAVDEEAVDEEPEADEDAVDEEAVDEEPEADEDAVDEEAVDEETVDEEAEDPSTAQPGNEQTPSRDPDSDPDGADGTDGADGAGGDAAA